MSKGFALGAYVAAVLGLVLYHDDHAAAVEFLLYALVLAVLAVAMNEDE